ncbi:MAG TPA: 3-oxoacyl-ACP reductase FabG [Caldimonas sp.]|jgi:3-oxoacyl-[acyl-carrier protein] reductase|nr:3-oxoacyl-ACP reductase FabG [Caldimonas sp.]HEV7578566.1 3-oxoacyl-ACP reductase FabG [Caldimonas sp.]
MDCLLQGKVALVTGSSRGLGLAEARALAAEGVRIAVNGRDAGTAEAAAATLRADGGRADAFAADVTDEAAVERLVADVVARCGSLDILVNNAGVAGQRLGKSVDEIESADWDAVIDSHLRSTFLCTKHAARAMKSRRWGRIVNTASVHVTGGGRPGVSSYSAAKAAVAGFGRTVAKELGAWGITVNTIAPGYIETDMLGGYSAEFLDTIRRQSPLGRLGKPEEVGALVAFLCSGPAAYITGALICIDGGRREYTWQ